MYFTLSKVPGQNTSTWRKSPLRLTVHLSFLLELGGGLSLQETSELYMCQAVISLAMTIWSKRRWDCICLSDEYHLQESRMSGFTDSEDPIERRENLTSTQYPPGLQLVRTNITDPIIEQEASCTHQDPRAYFLESLLRSLEISTDCAEELYEVFERPVIAQVSIISCLSYRWVIG